MNKIYQFLLKTFGDQPKWSISLKNTKNQLFCYGNHHSCYGIRRTFGSVTTKILTLFLSKNVYKAEIDKVKPKLWRFTFGTLILGHSVQYVYILLTKTTASQNEVALSYHRVCGLAKFSGSCFCSDYSFMSLHIFSYPEPLESSTNPNKRFKLDYGIEIVYYFPILWDKFELDILK